MAEAPTNRVLAGKLSDLPPNSGKIFRFGAKPGILIRTPAGEVRAFAAICTHLNCTVQYRADFQHIRTLGPPGEEHSRAAPEASGGL
ncbi:MAG: QcrA and Rieske domain-containing protein, partial [Thermoanaerobaculaceae bacterium]